MHDKNLSKVKNCAKIVRNHPKRNILFTNLMQFEDSKTHARPDKRSNDDIRRVMFSRDNAKSPNPSSKRQ